MQHFACKNVQTSGRKCSNRSSPTPIALQYIYGDVNKVQNEPLKAPKVHQVQDQEEFEEKELKNNYPFSIHNSLHDENKKSLAQKDSDLLVQDAELFRHGSADPDFKPSKIPCPGCGAKVSF